MNNNKGIVNEEPNKENKENKESIKEVKDNKETEYENALKEKNNKKTNVKKSERFKTFVERDKKDLIDNTKVDIKTYFKRDI